MGNLSDITGFENDLIEMEKKVENNEQEKEGDFLKEIANFQNYYYEILLDEGFGELEAIEILVRMTPIFFKI